MKTALITGISGQDGSYLARLLLARGYRVAGTSRDAGSAGFDGLAALGIAPEVATRTLDVTDPAAIAACLAEIAPDEIYHLGGSRRAEPPAHAASVRALLSGCRERPAARLFVAVCSAVFGDDAAAPIDETAAFAPVGAYAADQAAAALAVTRHRRDHGGFVASGLLFDHHSRLGDPAAWPAAIIAAAAAGGAAAPVADADVPRDLGWAPEYVDAMWRMLQPAEPRDYVLATGTAITPRAVAGDAARYFGAAPIPLAGCAAATPAAGRIGNPARAARDLGWRAVTTGRDLVDTLCDGYAAPVS